MKSVVSLIYCAIGWSNVAKTEYICSVGPSKPEVMGLPTGLGLWIFVSVQNIGIRGGLGVCKSYFLVMSSMCSPWCNWLMRSLTFSCVVFTIGALRRS